MRSDVASVILCAYPFARICACRQDAFILQAFINLISEEFLKFYYQIPITEN